jgi:hypothetical protein
MFAGMMKSRSGSNRSLRHSRRVRLSQGLRPLKDVINFLTYNNLGIF